MKKGICVSDYEKLLTVGKGYNVIGEKDDTFRVTNDRGSQVYLPKALFRVEEEVVTEKPKKKVEKNVIAEEVIEDVKIEEEIQEAIEKEVFTEKSIDTNKEVYD